MVLLILFFVSDVKTIFRYTSNFFGLLSYLRKMGMVTGVFT